MQRLELNSVLPFIERSIIPIITTPIYDQRAGTNGTGSIFNLNGKFYLICASHVFDDFDKYSESVGIPTGPIDSQIFSFGQSEFYRIDDKEQRDKYDIIIIEIISDIAERIGRNYNILTEANISCKFKEQSEFLLLGYPYLFSEDEASEKKVFAKPFRLSTRIRKPTGQEDKNFDPKAHFLLDYKQVSLEQEAPQELQGISGSPIWCYTPETGGIWTAEKNLKTIGITLSLKRNEYIKGVHWGYVIEMFKKIDPIIYDALKSSQKD